MKKGLAIDINPEAHSVKAAVLKLYKAEVANGTANAVDEIWDVKSTRQFGPTLEHKQARIQDSAESFRTYPQSSGERDWSSIPKRPPSPDSDSTEEREVKASKNDSDGSSNTYVHSYFDHISGAASFARAKKPELHRQQTSPGPADYHVEVSRFRSQSPRAVIPRGGQRTDFSGSAQTPGPGYYSPRLRLVHR